MNTQSIEGFDPLTENLEPNAPERGMFEEATKRVILNILKSYTGYFDVFSEIMQNSLDALDERLKIDANYEPKLWISIDLDSNRIRVVDNGIGMSFDQYLYCFRPNVSFKRRREHRGHKGVGATFLAYGFSLVKLQTKRNGSQISGQLRQGREWAEDTRGVNEAIRRPKFEQTDFDVPELANELSGTAIEIMIGDKQRPQLGWLQASKAQQWIDVLRMKTPLGGVYLSAKERKVSIETHLKVTLPGGAIDKIVVRDTEYFYPHEIPLLHKVQDIDSIERQINATHGDPSQRLQRLPNEFKRLDAIYKIWTKEDIIADSILSRNLDEDQKALIEKHDICVYGCFLSTAKSWTEFKEKHLGVRRTADLLKGGLQLASDYMIQGDLLVIPLTSTIGYQANTHVIVHLVDGNPDMGRKVFQPEIKVLAEELSRRVVDVCKRYLRLMREDTGAPSSQSSDNLWRWKMDQVAYRDKHNLEMMVSGKDLALLSIPQSEQDVISLFHEMLGAQFLRGYGIYATSESERYDCLFLINYEAENLLYSNEVPLGAAYEQLSGESQPYVMEYKFSFDALVADLERGKKFEREIDLVVCWTLGSDYKERFVIRSYLVGDEGSTRTFFGATHAAFRENTRVFEVICLQDLVSFVSDPEGIRALHKARFY